MEFYSKIRDIDRVIADTSAIASDELPRSIKEDRDVRRYFFSKVSSVYYFESLKEWFDPEKIEFDNGNALFWDVLDYLERVSEQVSQNTQYDKYGKELVDIIESVVQFSLNKKPINNYHIWWYCVKILNNLPASVIRENLHVEDTPANGGVRYGFRTWLITWTDPSMGVGNDLAISDIGIKLVEKFLKDESTIKYAGAIIDVITRIRPSRKKRTFARSQDVSLMWRPYWILETFRKHSQLIGEKCSVEAILGIADKLKQAFEYKQKIHHVNIEMGDNVYQIEASRIPAEGIGSEEIRFKEGQYQCSVRQFSEEQLKSVDRENDFLALHNIEPQIEAGNPFTFTAVNRDDFVLRIKDNLLQNTNWPPAEVFENKLTQLFDGIHYSHVWLKSLASGGRAHASNSDDAEDILTIILRDVLLAKCKVNHLEGDKILSIFLSDKYPFPIFRRFVLLCIDKYWSDYKELLERFFLTVPSVFDESDYEVELHDVLFNHNKHFDLDLVERLKELINDIPQYYLDKGENFIAYWKYKSFSPLRKHDDFKNYYLQAKEKVQPKDGKDYEPERSTFIDGLAVHKSSVSKEDILQKPVAEIVKYLNEFEGADFWHGTFEGEPDKKGLADVLQAAVRDEPNKFTDELDAFLNVDYIYRHRILRGLKEAWNAGNEIGDWENIFNFCLKYFRHGKEYILKEAIQAQSDDSGDGKYIWLVEDIADLIADGCRNDERAFDPKYFDKVELVFTLALPLLSGEKHPDIQRGAITYALNTSLGKTIRAYMSFSLCKVRVTKTKEEDWGLLKYERFFNIGIEAYIWFGYYLPQIKKLDGKFATAKIETLAKSNDYYEWEMFMEGYLSSGRVCRDLYSLMRLNYIKALESKTFEENTDEKLVQHISWGYLYYGELLDENNADENPSLFYKMLSGTTDLEKKERWLNVAGFFWSLTEQTIRKEDKDTEEDASKDVKKKVLEFWEWTYTKQDFVKDKLGEKYNSFLGKIASLTILLDKIDDVTEKWLSLSAPHIDQYHDATFFIEYLTKFEDKESIERIGRIFKKVLENTTPTFQYEDIELIVNRIYEKGNWDDAEAICNTYGRRGIHFLKPIWEKNQKKKA